MYAEGADQPNWYLDPLAAAQKREVHLEWIRSNVPQGVRIQTVLKTDLFEEAYGGDELLFSLPFDASLKIGFDVSAAVWPARRIGAMTAPAGFSTPTCGGCLWRTKPSMLCCRIPRSIILTRSSRLSSPCVSWREF